MEFRNSQHQELEDTHRQKEETMIALDRRKIVACIAQLVALPLIAIPLVVLVVFGKRPIPEHLQMLALGIGFFMADTLLFGSMYLEVPYEETDSQKIRSRQRAFAFLWAFLLLIFVLFEWRITHVG